MYLSAVNMERFAAKYRVEDECWIWTGARSGNGYGAFQNEPAHRVAFKHFKADIPQGAVIDHICRRPLCVNPDHLDAVSQRTNLFRADTIPATNAAKTSCKNGHEYNEANTYIWRGTRGCRTCRNASGNAAYHRNKGAVRPYRHHGC